MRKYGDPTKVVQQQVHGASLAERFFTYVTKGAACWEWSGGRDVNGYGRIRVDGRPQLAHRTSWELHHGVVPPGMHVLHRCDNPPCVNPDHLFLGDQAVNNHDKIAKGRSRTGVSRGEAHGCAVLTDDQVRQIRASTGPSRLVGPLFGISPRQVRAIRNREAWRHIP